MKKHNVKLKNIIHGTFLGTLIFMSSVTFALAATNDYTVLAPLPGTTSNCSDNSSGETDGVQCTTDLSTYLPGLFNLMIGVGAVAAFVVITIFGFEYMLTDSLLSKQHAKEWVTNALWGLGLIIFAYVILYTINPALLNGSLNISTPEITNQVNGLAVAANNAPYVINGFNIGPYATAAIHETVVNGIYTKDLANVNTSNSSSIDTYIQKYFPGSPVTGSMVTQAATQTNVDPKLMIAIMQTDSGFGTKGIGKNTANPGNIGNMDNGSIRNFNGNWQAGVTAVATWLNAHRAK